VRRIALFGMFGVGNIGNEATLEAVLHYIRNNITNTEIFCVCSNPGKVRTDHRVEAVKITADVKFHQSVFAKSFGKALNHYFRLSRIINEIKSWQHALVTLRDVDIMIVPGTGILDDFGVGPKDMPYDLFRWCISARLRGAKIKFISIGAGPIKNLLSRLLIKVASRMAQYRSYRDKLSRDFMASIGLNVSLDPIVPDLVFSLPLHDSQNEQLIPKEILTVGVGLMAYYGWKNRPTEGIGIYRTYINQMKEFILWLIEIGCNVRILIGEATDTRAVEDLLRAVHSIDREINRKKITSNKIQCFRDLLSEISETDLVVATRFHNIVAALMLFKPVLSCGYAKKNDILLDQMGLANCCQQIDKLDLKLLKEQFKNLVEIRSEKSRVIKQKIDKYREILSKQLKEVLSL